MNVKALQQLLGVREHRVSVARAALESKQRIASACLGEEQRLIKRLETLLMQRIEQQKNFGEQMQGAMTLAQAQQCDQFVGHLTDLATSVGEEIVVARKALAKANDEVTAARRALRHALAKRDALVNVQQKMMRDSRAARARVEEEQSEEIAARRVAVT